MDMDYDNNDEWIPKDINPMGFYGLKNLGYLGYLDFIHGLEIDANDFDMNDLNEQELVNSYTDTSVEFQTKIEVCKCCNDELCDYYKLYVFINDCLVSINVNNNLDILGNIEGYIELRIHNFNRLQVLLEDFMKKKYRKYYIHK